MTLNHTGFHFFFFFRCATANVLQFSVATMNLDKLPKCMGFTMSACKNMETPMSGNILPTFLITCPSQVFIKKKYFSSRFLRIFLGFLRIFLGLLRIFLGFLRIFLGLLRIFLGFLSIIRYY